MRIREETSGSEGRDARSRQAIAIHMQLAQEVVDSKRLCHMRRPFIAYAVILQIGVIQALRLL